MNDLLKSLSVISIYYFPYQVIEVEVKWFLFSNIQHIHILLEASLFIIIIKYRDDRILFIDASGALRAHTPTTTGQALRIS